MGASEPDGSGLIACRTAVLQGSGLPVPRQNLIVGMHPCTARRFWKALMDNASNSSTTSQPYSDRRLSVEMLVDNAL